MIPTAKEFLIEKKIANPLGERFRLNLSRDCHVQTEKNIQAVMIEFAKLHVDASKKEFLKYGFGRYMEHAFDKYPTRVPIDEDSISNVYPTSNIK